MKLGKCWKSISQKIDTSETICTKYVFSVFYAANCDCYCYIEGNVNVKCEC